MADYEEQLNEKLKAAKSRIKQGREVQALKKSAPTLFEIMDDEISLMVNKLCGEKPLSYEEYLDVHGRVRGIMRVRDLLNWKEAEAPAAAQEAEAIQDNLKSIKDGKK